LFALSAAFGHRGGVAEHLGARIKRLRLARGLGSRQLCRMCEAAAGAVTRWEAGELVPSLRHARLLARALKVSLDELVKGAELRPTKRVK